MPSPPAPPRSDQERLELLVDRTARLHRLTAHLSTALTLEEVAAIVVDEGTEALAARSGGLWRVDGGELVLVRANQYSAAALASVQRMPIDATAPIGDAVVRVSPIWLSSRADYAARYERSAARTNSMTSQDEYSVAALPIVLEGRAVGVLALAFHGERGFDEDERTYLTFLALHCAQGFQRARLYESERAARREAEIAHERAHFLSKASALLGSSLDYEETLRNVANLAVPNIGDWCGVELLDEHGVPKQVAVAHVDPEKVQLARDLRVRYPQDPDAKTGVPNVLRTGQSELYEEIPDELLVRGAHDAEHLRISRELGLRSAMIVPIRDRGNVLGTISFVIADSPRRYTRDDLLMAEQLGERAGAAISNAVLYTQAREAIRMRDEFMLIAGHELRTPLAALSLHHESLKATRDGTPLDKIRERGAKLVAQSERLHRLVEELLDVSRLSAGRLTMDPEDFDLGVLVREVAERMRDDLERSRTPITIDVEPVHGRWDKARIDQVVTNLIGNAGKYGKGAAITVQLRNHDGNARLVVSDHGIGISAEDQPRIFQRFERAVSSRKFSGLGLGLWIASQLVAAHGGTIGVESEPGAGATFTVVLPLAPPS